MNDATAFEQFGASHIAALAAVLLAAAAFPWLARRDPEHRLALPIAALLILHEVFKLWLFTVVDEQRWAHSLPLDLCRLNSLLCAYLLIRRSYAVFEVSYFWAMAGSTAALLNPALLYDFPDVRYFTFFVGHASGILVVIYAIVGFGFRPTRRSLYKALLVTAAYAAVMAAVNYAFGTNYLFLREKPRGASVLDAFGPWPYYVFALLAIAALACVVCYLPFAWRRTRHAFDGPRR